MTRIVNHFTNDTAFNDFMILLFISLCAINKVMKLDPPVLCYQ
jgi:hypothetical protein